MAARKAIDTRPGPLPDIRSDGDSLTFRMELAGAERGSTLVIRCDSSGNVWASIVAQED